jgi:hypothetical protein
VSDFGSLNTVARSFEFDQQSEDEAVVDDEDEEIGEEEEDAELDSLDSHLHEFRSEPSVYRRHNHNAETGGTVLPTHDGLGSFRIDRPGGMGEEVQEHLYSFERYNPRRVKRRRESLERGQLELESERAADVERVRRIEKWRLEQSRLLVDEIQKETRRRRLSASTDRRVGGGLVRDQEQEDLATLSTIGSQTDAVDAEDESFWNRVTRRVIRDLIGIDDDMLSIIFGETLPEDDDLSTTPPAGPASNGMIRAAQYDEFSWEHKLVERITRELGILANQISDHPGAFNTYLRTQQIPLPYAGLPMIPESSRTLQQSNDLDIHHSTTTIDPVFEPTIQSQTNPVTIPQPTTTSLAQSSFIDENATPRTSQHILTREEWEADLDIKLVFSYLRNRITSKFRSSSSSHPSSFSVHTTSHLATASTADTAARAARVRQHHPLVTRETRERERRRSIERRTWKVSVPEAGPMRPGARRGSSSCASERLAAMGVAGAGVRSGSSRHYWDFGPGSVGSGSLVGGVGGGGGVMGSWGEV